MSAQTIVQAHFCRSTFNTHFEGYQKLSRFANQLFSICTDMPFLRVFVAGVFRCVECKIRGTSWCRAGQLAAAQPQQALESYRLGLR